MSKAKTHKQAASVAAPMWQFYAAWPATLALVVTVWYAAPFLWLMLLPILFNIIVTLTIVTVRSSRTKLLLLAACYLNLAVMIEFMLHYCLLNMCT